MMGRSPAEVPRPDAGILSMIRESSDAVHAQPDEFVEALYRHLFTLLPAAESLFPFDIGPHGTRMSRELIRAARALDVIVTVEDDLRRLGAEHARNHSVPFSYYPYLGQALIHAIREIFPGSDGSALGSAWMSVYEWIAAQMLAGAVEAVPEYVPPRPRGVAPVPAGGSRSDWVTDPIPRLSGVSGSARTDTRLLRPTKTAGQEPPGTIYGSAGGQTGVGWPG
jgi:hemoglobin-like flavoprotein